MSTRRCVRAARTCRELAPTHRARCRSWISSTRCASPFPRPAVAAERRWAPSMSGIRMSWNSSVRSARAAACGSSTSRSEEHTSELQSQFHLVCRLLLEKKKFRIFLMSRKIILIKQELLLLVYELNRSGLLAENEKIRPILAQLEKRLLCDLSPSTNDSVKN